MGYGYDEYSEMGFDDLSNDYDYDYDYDYEDGDDYLDYDEISWDDYEKYDEWPKPTLWQRIKMLMRIPLIWYREKTGYYDDIPF